MDSIKKFVQDSLEIKDHMETEERMKVKFSVTVDGITNSRLQHVAKLLGTSRASLSTQLLELALQEAERELGLNFTDLTSEYAKTIYKENSGYFINGKKVSKEKYENYEAKNGDIMWQSNYLGNLD